MGATKTLTAAQRQELDFVQAYLEADRAKRTFAQFVRDHGLTYNQAWMVRARLLRREIILPKLPGQKDPTEWDRHLQELIERHAKRGVEG